MICLNYIFWTEIVSRSFSLGLFVLDFVEKSMANELLFTNRKKM